MLANKFRLYPNKEQTKKLEFTLDTCRQAYNMLLGELQNQIVIDKNMIQAILPDLKICEPKFKEVYSKTLQYECYKLFSNLSALKALKGNHRKVGKLRFKGKGWFKTINYNQSGFSLKKNKLNLSKIGNIKINIHRKVIGDIKQVQIKKELNKWYAIIVTNGQKKITHGEKIIGIDLGINNYLVDNNGNKIDNPRILEQNLQKLKQLQKKLSKKIIKKK